MGFVVYDWEAGGLETSYDKGFQFAAIRADDHLNEVTGPDGSIDITGRLPSHYVPSPGALLTTGVSLDTLARSPRSHYELIRDTYRWMGKEPGTVFLSYNGMKYDESLNRNEFYQHLLPPYLTNTNRNVRMDLLRVLYACDTFLPGVINVPTRDTVSRGKPVTVKSFKLGDMCRANGIEVDETKTHDALYDVRLTCALAQVVWQKAAPIWLQMIDNASKRDAVEFARNTPVFVLTEYYFNKPYTKFVTFAANHNNDEGDVLLYDLSFDPQSWAEAGPKQLIKGMKDSPKVFVPLVANKQPIIMPLDKTPPELLQDMADKLRIASDLPDDERARLAIQEMQTRAQALRDAKGFGARLQEAMAERWPKREPSPHVEERIYDGFPNQADSAAMARFHEAPWIEKARIALSFEDARLRELAERIVFEEKPELLTPQRRAAMEQWRHERLTESDNEGLGKNERRWLTVEEALTELEAETQNARWSDKQKATIPMLRAQYEALRPKAPVEAAAPAPIAAPETAANANTDPAAAAAPVQQPKRRPRQGTLNLKR